jgi:hypothetical protein
MWTRERQTTGTRRISSEQKATARILVVGGSGTFGRHLVRGLLAHSDLSVVIGGRNLARAKELEARLCVECPNRPLACVRLDRRSITEADLRALQLFAVVDASGPFQGTDYRLPRAAIAAGVHYVDLADARDFVAGFSALDEAAKRAGVVAITGASSTPALSNAVLDRLTQGWQSIDTIDVGISPGNRAPRGHSVVAAILSYAGGRCASSPTARGERGPAGGSLSAGRCRELGGAGSRSARRRTSTSCRRASRSGVPRSSAPGSSFRSCISAWRRRQFLSGSG